MEYRILYEDEALLVVYKPAGLAVQNASVGVKDLESLLKKHLSGASKGTPYLGIVHRLDQPVEGILAFGKTKEAAAKLARDLSKKELKKEYLCLALLPEKECPSPEGKLVNFLKKEGNLARVLSKKEEGGKRSALFFECMREFPSESGEGFGLFRICLQTGRFHQIRAQMAYAGMPLLGDLKYGNEVSKRIGRELGLKCLALCADRLVLRHPKTGKKLSFETKPAFFERI